MKQSGFFWHVHHDKLIEWCFSYEERVNHIEKNKPKNEQKLRLRLFQPVKGKLPDKVVEVWQAYNEATQVYYKSGRARDVAYQYWKAISRSNESWQCCDSAKQAYCKTLEAFDKASRSYDKTRLDLYNVLRRNEAIIEALHEEECPNCPWNGHTIF